MKKLFIIIAVLLLLGAGAYFLFFRNNKSAADTAAQVGNAVASGAVQAVNAVGDGAAQVGNAVATTSQKGSIAVYVKALEAGIAKTVDDMPFGDAIKYTGISADHGAKRVICTLEANEEHLVGTGQSIADYSQDDMQIKALKAMVYPQIADYVKPIHALQYDFVIRVVGSESKQYCDVLFPYNE